MSLLLILNKFNTMFWCFHCWLWTNKCWLVPVFLFPGSIESKPWSEVSWNIDRTMKNLICLNSAVTQITLRSSNFQDRHQGNASIHVRKWRFLKIKCAKTIYETPELIVTKKWIFCFIKSCIPVRQKFKKMKQHFASFMPP